MNQELVLHKIAVVTGASRGLGRAIALALARAGANLVLIARDTAALQRVASEAEQLGRRALALPCDVTAESEVTAAAHQV